MVFHSYDWLCHLATYDHAMVQIRWSCDKANHSCETPIKDFGHLYSHTTDAASNWPHTFL